MFKKKMEAGYAFGMKMHEDIIDRMAEENRRLNAINEVLRLNNDSLARQLKELKEGKDSGDCGNKGENKA